MMIFFGKVIAFLIGTVVGAFGMMMYQNYGKKG